VTVARRLRWAGVLATSFFAVHTVEVLVARAPWDAVWACHVSCLWIAAGCFFRAPVPAAIGVSWLSYGTPTWLLDLASGGVLVKTSILSHLGGLAVGLFAARLLGWPRGTWWKALAALLALVLVTRLTTAPLHNVNLAFAVHPGWERYFPTYDRYFLFLLFTNALVFRLAERLARAALTKPTGQKVHGLPQTERT
jgi:hypothetical protein